MRSTDELQLRHAAPAPNHAPLASLIAVVAGCLVVSLTSSWVVAGTADALPWLSWTCLLLIAFPSFLHASPRRTLATAVAGAATVPLSAALLGALGHLEIGTLDHVGISLVPLFSAVVANLRDAG